MNNTQHNNKNITITTEQAVNIFEALKNNHPKVYYQIQKLEILKMNGKISPTKDSKLLTLYKDYRIVPLKGNWFLEEKGLVRTMEIKEVKKIQEKEFNNVMNIIKGIPNHLLNNRK